ncbi:MAG: GDP-mannose 4,6-dehydratase [Bdellovibrionota bacterium]
MRKHYVVTGGAGFIGSHVCDALLALGHAVTAVDSLITGRTQNLKSAKQLGGDARFQFLEWDVCQAIPEGKLEFLPAHGLAGVFHLACPASPIDFGRIPFEILAVDSEGTKHTVNLALKHGAKYLLASTSEVYGDPLVHPQSEEYWGNVNPVGFRACYDEAKRFAEAYVSTAIRYSKLDGRIIRIFNTYGPRMRPDDGRIVPELCTRAIAGKPLTIHGDGKQTRSFCFVDDLVDGMLRLFKSDYRSPMNIGNPKEYTVLEFVDSLQRILGRERVPLVFEPGRPDDPRRRCPDVRKARELLGWEAKTDLDSGLRACVRYFESEAD